MRVRLPCAVLSLSIVVAGCGGSVEIADESNNGDGGADTTAAFDSGGVDATPIDDTGALPDDTAVPVDTSPPGDCVGRMDGSACTLFDGSKGLCKSSACAPCVDPTDDAACKSAHGGGTTSYLCVSGACTLAECRTDANCATAGKPGQICGLASANQCGRCTSDAQCKAASGYGTSTICSIATGTCVLAQCGVAATTGTTTTPNTACSNANPADFCCGAVGTTPGTCVPGNCCTDAQCSTGNVCRSNVCTACPAVTDNTYYVDPATGSDTASTGSTTCAFKTISRAVAYLSATYGTAVPAGTRILLRGKATAATGETFPIRVPPNVTVSSATTTIQTVEVAAGRLGFTLATANSAITNLTIAGLTTAYVGVAAVSGANSTLGNVTVTGMRNDGVYVEGGTLKIGAGVHVDKNGVSGIGYPQGNGMRVVAGSVAITVNTGEATTSFNENVRAGIFVENNGFVTVTGVPDITGYPTSTNPPAVASGTGTVTTNRNFGSGVFLVQSGTATNTNVINGLVSWRNGANGMRVVTPSRVTLRSSVTAGNGDNGVAIAMTNTSTPSTAGIDLGSDPFGKNILQTPSNGNAHAGICVGYLPIGTVIRAKGNYFNGKNCSVTPIPTPLPIVNFTTATYASAMDCGSVAGVDVAVSRNSSGGLPTGITVDLDNCADVIYP